MVISERRIRLVVNCIPIDPAGYLLALLAVSGASHLQNKAIEMGRHGHVTDLSRGTNPWR